MHRDTQPGRALLLIALLAPLNVARADPSVVTMNGVPAQVIPSIPEVGAPTFVTPAGAGSFMGDGGGPTSADGSTSTDGSTGTSNSSTDWSGYSGGGTQAMDAMMATPYGNLAASAATQLGLNPEAMAGLGACCEIAGVWVMDGWEKCGIRREAALCGSLDPFRSPFPGLFHAADRVPV